MGTAWKANGLFSQLRVLILNSTRTSWRQIDYFASCGCFPKLEELHMCANMLESFESAFEPSVGGALGMAQDLAKAKVASARQGLTELKHLDLSGNCISSWEQIEPLGLL